MKLTKIEALEMMIRINQANHQKKPYVRVSERTSRYYDIIESNYMLYSHVNVYSKTWSRRVAKLIPFDYVNRLIITGKKLNLREARKVLA